MQKDIHFYLTYALAVKVGIEPEVAQKIAWADQYTDDMTKADVYEIQTQSDILGNWGDRQIQLSVLVPFHFMPGDGENKWVVTADSSKAKKLVKAAMDDPFWFGIALHAFQDTFSHQSFSGWEEESNSCFNWHYLRPQTAVIPNVGHADLMGTPDVVHYIWTDPRTGKQIKNWERAMSCAQRTYLYLCQFNNKPEAACPDWLQIAEQLKPIFQMSYDERKMALMEMVGETERLHYGLVGASSFLHIYKSTFIAAARRHLSEVMRSL